MNTLDVIELSTGIKKIAVYAPNRNGNKRFNVEGKFYIDAIFDSLFKLVPTCECGEKMTWFKGEFICSQMTVKNNCPSLSL